MNKAKLESKVLHFIQQHNLILPREMVVVGVSGGADSVCLLHVLARLQKTLKIRLHAAHLNHQLRGAESDADAEYVSKLAGSLGIPITIDKQDVAAYKSERNCSLEEAARELRYAFFVHVARKVGANCIAVGHTRDDQVETILMHLLRGTGTTGLCGLAPCSPLPYDKQVTLRLASEPSLPAPTCRGNLMLIRPLLDISRKETMSYCQEHELQPRMDSSNISLSFFRNRLRLQLLPLLREYNPNIDQALLRLADIAREDIAFIGQKVAELWDEVVKQENDAIYLDSNRIAKLPIALQRQLFRTAMAELIGDIRDVEAIHIEAARSLLNRPTGKRLNLPRGLVCQAGYKEIVITTISRQSQLMPCPFPPLSGQHPLKIPGSTTFPGWRVTASITRRPFVRASDVLNSSEEIDRTVFFAQLDFHKTGSKLFVRQRRPGDRFQPLGMNMPKKLYDFMVDAKIPRSWRDCIPIVCSPHQIIWVVSWRIDDRVKVTEATKEILRLEFARLE